MESEVIDPINNKFLTFKAGVIRTEHTDPVIARLEPYFAARSHHALVTSVYRHPEAQLRLIQDLARKEGIDILRPEITYAILDGQMTWVGHTYYQWQLAWSKLLSIGVIISPPIDAVALFDYWKDGINNKDQSISASSHRLGTAFDIGGRGGEGQTRADEVEIVQGAMKTDPNIGIRSITVERKNNCLHVSCFKLDEQKEV